MSHRVAVLSLTFPTLNLWRSISNLSRAETERPNGWQVTLLEVKWRNSESNSAARELWKTATLELSIFNRGRADSSRRTDRMLPCFYLSSQERFRRKRSLRKYG